MRSAVIRHERTLMIIVLLADGFEEIEALTPLDMLRRCGLDVRTVGITSKIAVGSHGISVICDLLPDEVPLEEVSMAIFPGGMPGSLNLDASPFTDKVIAAVQKNGGRLAAICAAPLVLGRRGLLDGRLATCYPGFEEELKGAITLPAGVVTDGNITTAQGMGVSLDFALELIDLTLGFEKAAEMASAIRCSEPYDKRNVTRAGEAKENVAEPDGKLAEAIEIVIEAGKASTSLLQRKLSIGYGRAATLIDTMEEMGIISAPNGTSPREVLITREQWKAVCEAKNVSEDRARDHELIAEVTEIANAIVDFYENRGISVRISKIERGHSVGVYGIDADDIDRVTELSADLAAALDVGAVRFAIDIDGRMCAEVENKTRDALTLSSVAGSFEFANAPRSTAFCVGMSAERTPVFADLARCGNTLVTGGTSAEIKNVLLTVALSVARKAKASEVKLAVIDPKNELSELCGLEHLYDPVATDKNAVENLISDLLVLAEERRTLVEALGVIGIEQYNERIKASPDLGAAMPHIALIVNGADKEYEQMLEALVTVGSSVGIYTVIADTRANIPKSMLSGIKTRMCLRTDSAEVSARVIGSSDAVGLLGDGDMLYLAARAIAPIRVQTPTVIDKTL